MSIRGETHSHSRSFRTTRLVTSWSAHLAGKTAIAVLLCGLVSAPAASGASRNLADLTLEQLMNESITSVSKKEQRLGDAAAAVAVITNEDLRRTGADSVPEALRWVPGVNVGQVNSSQWSVSARGFNSTFSNKLLVLVDGRAVYSSFLAGVFWDLQ